MGLVSQVQVLKVGVLMWGSNPLVLRVKPGILSSILIVGCCTRGGVYGKIMLQPLLCFDVGSLLFAYCVAVSQLVLGFLLEEIVMYVVDLMCLWEEVCLGSCVTHLQPEPSQFNFIDAKRGHMVCGHRILSPWDITGSNIIYMHIGRILRWPPIFLPPGVHTPSLSYPTKQI